MLIIFLETSNIEWGQMTPKVIRGLKCHKAEGGGNTIIGKKREKINHYSLILLLSMTVKRHNPVTESQFKTL